ncbi:MAG: MBL fold metallo-hydrolase [Candidatus Margulisbacteria bacterium]|nr:MBL fold metallo-hydrolase [Candidatus Margulisiibacteriota bacterium]
MQVQRIRVGAIDTICYIITTAQNQSIIIDPGAEPDKITSFIEQKKIVPKFILLTHGHYDHIEAINVLRQKYQLPVYVSEEDQKLLKPEIWSLLLGRNFANVSAADHLLKDGDTLELDELTVNVIYTPGHSPGSLSFVIENCVFSGDTLFAGGAVGRTDLWGGSQEQIVNSIKNKLFLLPDDYIIYPGHGNSSTIGKEKAIHSRYKILN